MLQKYSDFAEKLCSYLSPHDFNYYLPINFLFVFLIFKTLSLHTERKASSDLNEPY